MLLPPDKMLDKRRLLGAKLAEARRKQGLTIREIAQKIGTYSSLISNCENAQRNISALELWVFCQHYEIDFATLVEEVMNHPDRPKPEFSV
jgi:transcriptional regulator with XRE-family HTH domain